MRSVLVWLLGVSIGFVFERLGFGFSGAWRKFILQRDATGITAQLVAIGLTAAIIQPIIAFAPGNFVGAVAPVSLTMIISAFVFGSMMQIILGCGSGILINAGSGNLVGLVALPMVCFGSFIGTLLMPIAFEMTPHFVIDFGQLLGTAGSVMLTISGLVLLWLIMKQYSSGSTISSRLVLAAVILAGLASLHVLIAGQPWGVVYGLGLWVAKILVAFGWDSTTASFWTHSVNAEALKSSVLTDVTSLTSIGLVFGAAIACWSDTGGQFVAERVGPWFFICVIAAALLMGISSRLAFGCNIGALFSGIASGSFHGWVWLFAAFIGSNFGIQLRELIWTKTIGSRT